MSEAGTRAVPAVPVADELREMPIHVIVRDYPETMAVFRDAGVDVPRTGGEPVEAAVEGGAEVDALLDALRGAIDWRPPGATS